MKPDLDEALKRIDALAAAKLTSTGAWTPHQVFSHCAQSIEYSMSGYPTQKPVLFQRTVGALAFKVFASKGKMRHGLDAAIPGAPPLLGEGSAEQGLQRLREAFLAFRQHQGALAPHFAYGTLTREQYEAAHVMHFINHLDEIRIR